MTAVSPLTALIRFWKLQRSYGSSMSSCSSTNAYMRCVSSCLCFLPLYWWLLISILTTSFLKVASVEVVTHLYNDDSVAASDTYNVATRYGHPISNFHSSSIPCHNSLISMSQQSHSSTTTILFPCHSSPIPVPQVLFPCHSSPIPVPQVLFPYHSSPIADQCSLFFPHVTAAMVFLWEEAINRVFICSQGTGIFGLGWGSLTWEAHWGVQGEGQWCLRTVLQQCCV